MRDWSGLNPPGMRIATWCHPACQSFWLQHQVDPGLLVSNVGLLNRIPIVHGGLLSAVAYIIPKKGIGIWLSHMVIVHGVDMTRLGVEYALPLAAEPAVEKSSAPFRFPFWFCTAIRFAGVRLFFPLASCISPVLRSSHFQYDS